MDVYGRLRVREYNTLHRAIRKSSWGPVRCNIALHLRMETVSYSPSNLNTVSARLFTSSLQTGNDAVPGKLFI